MPADIVQIARREEPLTGRELAAHHRRLAGALYEYSLVYKPLSPEFDLYAGALVEGFSFAVLVWIVFGVRGTLSITTVVSCIALLLPCITMAFCYRQHRAAWRGYTAAAENFSDLLAGRWFFSDDPAAEPPASRKQELSRDATALAAFLKQLLESKPPGQPVFKAWPWYVWLICLAAYAALALLLPGQPWAKESLISLLLLAFLWGAARDSAFKSVGKSELRLGLQARVMDELAAEWRQVSGTDPDFRLRLRRHAEPGQINPCRALIGSCFVLLELLLLPVVLAFTFNSAWVTYPFLQFWYPLLCLAGGLLILTDSDNLRAIEQAQKLDRQELAARFAQYELYPPPATHRSGLLELLFLRSGRLADRALRFALTEARRPELRGHYSKPLPWLTWTLSWLGATSFLWLLQGNQAPLYELGLLLLAMLPVVLLPLYSLHSWPWAIARKILGLLSAEVESTEDQGAPPTGDAPL